jgi:hypothetical protein
MGRVCPHDALSEHSPGRGGTPSAAGNAVAILPSVLHWNFAVARVAIGFGSFSVHAAASKDPLSDSGHALRRAIFVRQTSVSAAVTRFAVVPRGTRHRGIMTR